jgi:flagellar assembly factor FliW
MPLLETKYFGPLPYREESIFSFPDGLPSFDDEKSFLPIELPQNAPLLFLQSLMRPSLCFLALPILAVDREYHLAISPEDLAGLELDPGRQPALASEVLVLALVSMHDGFSPTANLMAPIVVNVITRRALQAIRNDSAYSHQQAISLQDNTIC